MLVFHVRSVSKERLKKRIGHITAGELEQAKQGLVDILKY